MLIEVDKGTNAMRTRTLSALLIAVTLVIVVGDEAGATGSNSCTTGNVCVSYVGNGSITHGFPTGQNTYTYWGIYWSPSSAGMINDQVGYVRNRNSTYPYACFYLAQGWTGGVGGVAPYYGASWVLAYSQNISSHYLHQVNDC